jgi:hypothetical protein
MPDDTSEQSYWVCPTCSDVDCFITTGHPLGGPANPHGRDLGQWRTCKHCNTRYHLAPGEIDPNVRTAPAPTWHRGRDDFGTILGPNITGEGHPYIARGVTLADARLRYPTIIECGPIPIVIDRPETSSTE